MRARGPRVMAQHICAISPRRGVGDPQSLVPVRPIGIGEGIVVVVEGKQYVSRTRLQRRWHTQYLRQDNLRYVGLEDARLPIAGGDPYLGVVEFGSGAVTAALVGTCAVGNIIVGIANAHSPLGA
jgi:hypothetical protein